MNRRDFVERINKESGTIWDLVIIGGGATGLGIALDAASRGYKTLLLEQSDFAKGTSSRSTKLVHGGVRYMAQGDLLLVMEALHERGIMLRNAPHLTYNQEFVIPVYSIKDVFIYTVGLKFYDLLAGRLSMGKSYFINREQTLERLSVLKSEGLKGGIVYHDGQFDDSRMAISLAQSCIDRGGVVLNYCRVTGFTKDKKGVITGVTAIELDSGKIFEMKANLVINATGVFADSIAKMDDPQSKPTLRPSQGVHIVIDRSFLKSDSAIMIPKTDDGRVLFAIPWYDEVVIGTTDTPLDSISLEPVALHEEIDFILKTAGKYLRRAPGREDILSVFAGLRPLAADSGNGSTREVSRRHKITFSASGLLTIIGGKWTTYRRMAEDSIEKAIRRGRLRKSKCITADLRISTIPSNSERLHIYGDNFEAIKKIMNETPGTSDLMDMRLPYTKAEIIWICRNEMPFKLEDVLARRTRALFLNARASAEIAPVVAAIMAGEMGHDKNWESTQVSEYNQIVKNYF